MNETDPLHAFLAQPLQNAVDYVNRFHQSTVLTVAARRRESDAIGNNKQLYYYVKII
jgi:hypothetical protein